MLDKGSGGGHESAGFGDETREEDERERVQTAFADVLADRAEFSAGVEPEHRLDGHEHHKADTGDIQRASMTTTSGRARRDRQACCELIVDKAFLRP